MVAGNTVVFKHSEECPLTAQLIESVINSHLPKGVFNQIYGTGSEGDFLVHQAVDLICFTGSTKVGTYLYRQAAKKFVKAILEMGGSAPGVIFADADIDHILESIYFNRFLNSGQMCDALKRLLVHESIYEETVTKLKHLLQTKKLGDPANEITDIGPLVTQRQVILLEAQVKDAITKGAKIEIGGKRPVHLHGAFFEPTLLTNVTSNMRVWKEEVFGPVLPILSFKTDTEAILLANDTSYGLGAYIYTQNEQKAQLIAKQLKSGMVSINGVSYLQPTDPFGGYKFSGKGREHGKFGFADVTQIKVVAKKK